MATTHLIDRIARRFSLPIFRTPVGFKFIADLFLRDKIIFGGEESAALSVRDHLPEKDGIIAGLLVAEMVAVTGVPLAELIRVLFKDYGERVGGQRSVVRTPERKQILRRLIKTPPTNLAGRAVVEASVIDGVKFDFSDDDWLLLRFSGTEPIIRCYAEAGSKKEMLRLLKAGLEKLG